MYKKLGIAAIATALLAVGVIFMLQKNTGSTLLRVVAAENVWGNIAAQIGGDRVQVTSIMSDPSTDPHVYETGAKDASAITTANVVIANGLGYDDFIDDILATAPNPNRTVIKAADAFKTAAYANPHLWYDLPRVKVLATTIKTTLSAKDPAGAATYAKNLDTFLQSMEPLFAKLDAIHASYNQAPIAYTERVAGYVIEQSGLTVASPASFAAAIEDGNEPSPADQTAMLSLIERKQIRALLYNAQTESPVTKKMREAAEAANIPVVAVTETMPAGYPTFQTWQLAQLGSLFKALGGDKQ